MQHTILPGRRDGRPLTASSSSTPLFGRPSLAPGVRDKLKPLTFSNPILPAPAQDPQIAFVDGQYYYCESSAAGIFLRVSDDFLQLARAPRVLVWSPPRRGAFSKNVWAPELHVIEGQCFIYFAGDDGLNANHRMGVLVSERGPLGPYRLAGSLDTEGWAIDGTILTGRKGERYFVWSGWPGRTDGQQNLYISRMSDPLKLSGERVLISTPDRPWERRGMPICEGPQVLQRGHRTFVIYSASASWTADYGLGMLVNESGDFMNPAMWRKTGPVFARNEHTWGVGHCGFLRNSEGQDWIFYHAKTRVRPGWEDREVRAQRFYWTDDGFPMFGEPAPSGQLLRR